jgi:ribonuclease-3
LSKGLAHVIAGFPWLKALRTTSAVERPPSPLEIALGYRFANPALLAQALSHRSHVNADGRPLIESNERLEFLGDAVLDLAMTEYLFRSSETETEGQLAKIKSLVVSARVLAEVARALGIGAAMLLSRSEDRAGGRDRESILADAYESIIGAIYLDGGYAAAETFIRTSLFVRMSEFRDDRALANYKSALLEYSQSKGWGVPHYEVLKTEGPEHSKVYHIGVRVQGELWGQGTGANKKEAEQAAARQALDAREISAS